jgi:hypothetical protein
MGMFEMQPCRFLVCVCRFYSVGMSLPLSVSVRVLNSIYRTYKLIYTNFVDDVCIDYTEGSMVFSQRHYVKALCIYIRAIKSTANDEAKVWYGVI